jgi:hypothetical protein
MLILAVDPGVRGSGVAIFDEATKTLLRADYVKGSAKGERAEAWLTMAAAVEDWAKAYGPLRHEPALKLVIECPQVYQRSHMSARKRGTDPNDLIQLAAVVGAIVARVGQMPTVLLPMEWKGQVDKAVMWDRALKRLSPEEFERVPGAPKVLKSLAHNMHDAIMLGLVHLGRLGKFSDLPSNIKSIASSS